MTHDEIREKLAIHLHSARQTIQQACDQVKRDPTSVTMIAVTKTVSAEIAALLPEFGVTHLGESRPQVLWDKAEQISGVHWHMIGHMQRNKLDRTLPLLDLMHSVDSDRLLAAVQAWGAKYQRPVPVLLEVNCSREEAKGGISVEALDELMPMLADMPYVNVRGFMTMAAYHDDPEQCRGTFVELRQLRDHWQETLGREFPELSMGMSNDYAVAVQEGATMVRLGTTLFGEFRG